MPILWASRREPSRSDPCFPFSSTAPGHEPFSHLLEHHIEGPSLAANPLLGVHLAGETRWKNTELDPGDQGPQSDQVSPSDPR